MRLGWTFVVGVIFAVYVMLWSAPIGIGMAYLASLGGHINLFHAFSGESVFGLRQVAGRTQARMVNVSFRPMSVAMPDQPRPRRLLMRLEVIDPDVFDGSRGLGRVRLDAWSLEVATELMQAPLYTVIAPGRAAFLEDDAVLNVENGSRHSIYSLAKGEWLYDADGAVAVMPGEGERRRLLAAAAADDEMPPGSIAVVTYASPQTVLSRLLISASDATRARLLRTSVSLIRPSLRTEPGGQRWADLAMPAGTIRIPLNGDSLDIAHADVPVGLRVAPFTPWKPR